MTDATAIAVRHSYQPSASSSLVAVKLITVATAAADWSYKALADPRQIQFFSRHVGVVTSWDWSFGDGTPNSTLRDPSHQFEVVGDSTEYDVRLTVNAGPFEEKTITVFQLTVLPGPLDLDAYTLTVDQANNMTVEQATNMTVT